MKRFIDRYFAPKEVRSRNSKSPIANWDFFWKLGFQTVKDLETEKGILASGKNEIYGAIFGRDSLITSLKLLKVYNETKINDFLKIVEKVLFTLADLQGKEINIESGEEPGKCIHEYRVDNHEHLTSQQTKPWFVYPDGTMRNFDTVDATSLFLIAVYRFYQASEDKDFLKQILPHVVAALNWIENFSDKNGDGFVDYELNPKRHYGGLVNQNWMDSTEATFHEDGSRLVYPIAPVEAQAYTYLALRLWGKHFRKKEKPLAEKLETRAKKLKKLFNEKFLLFEGASTYLANALDGSGKALVSARSSMGHVLWASLTGKEDGEVDSILAGQFIKPLVGRLLRADMFEPEAGIRTLSSLSVGFSPNSYHNGSIWPHDNSMIADGFENFGFLDEAELVREALLKAVFHFKTPIELFVYDKTYLDYFSEVNGQTSCKTQAWSAAAILGAVSPSYAVQTKGQIKTFIYRLDHKQISHFLTNNLFTRKLGPWALSSSLKAPTQAVQALEEITRKPLLAFKKIVKEVR